MPNAATSRGRIVDNPQTHRAWELCSVVDYSPQGQTYTVSAGSGALLADVPRVVGNPGEISVLPRGTEVVVNYELNGRPVIFGVLKSAVTNAVEVNPARISEVRGVGGEAGVYAQEQGHPPNDPVDVIADDWIRKSRHNNFLGVLSGGTNVMSSSPMAQIRTHGVNDMVEVFANVYRHISALGNLNITNDGGKTSLTWRAGADQLTENGANAENWTLRLDAGATGDLFRLSVTTPNNNTLCELHMSAEGRLSLTGVAGVDISSGTRGTAREDVAENKEVDVLGSMATTVGGAVLETFNAGKETLVATNDVVSAGNDVQETIGHDRLTYIGNKLHTTVEGGGAIPPPTPGNRAIFWNAVNGSIESVTGDPASGGIPTARQAQSFVNYAGDFNFAVPLTGKFNIISSTPDSVLLGASGAAIPGMGGAGHSFTAVAPKHVCTWEDFQTLMTTIFTWLDNHTHLTAMGPSSPAQASATGPITPTAAPKVALVKSLRVTVGA